MLRLIVTVVGRATECESIFPVRMTRHCRSLTSMGAGNVMGLELTSMGAGNVMGLEGRPVFTTPTAVWKHLERVRTYGEARWAQKQKARTAKRQAKTKGTARKPAARQPGAVANPERKRCLAKGGAKSALKHYATEFYAKPEKAPAERRDKVFAPSGGAATGGGSDRPAAPIFMPPTTRDGVRKKETQRRLTKSLVCKRHGNPPLPTCVLTHRGARHCCSKGGAPRPPEGHLHTVHTETHTTARAAGQPAHPGGGGHASAQAAYREDSPWGPARTPRASPPTSPQQRGEGNEATKGDPRPSETRQAPNAVARPCGSYGYSNPMGYQTSNFRLLWAITPNPQPPKPPMIGLCPPPPPISHLCFAPHIRLGSPPFSLAQFCTLLPLQTMTVGMN